ncbi:2-hydroxyacid dehydrogenase [Burkholderia sp. MR1-5-21]
MKIKILSVAPLMPEFEAQLEEAFDVFRLYNAADPAALLEEVAPTIRGVVTSGGAGLERAVMDALPLLEIVAVNGVGVDKIDLTEASRRGIRVTTTPDVLTDSVADLAVALVLACARDLCVADRYVRSEKWLTGDSLPLGKGLRHRSAGIVGLGKIGAAIATRLSAFGMNIGYHNRRPVEHCSYRYFSNPVDLAAASDVLIVAVAGGPESLHLIDHVALEALGSSGYLINVARGSCVDEDALIDALRTGAIAGAGLDVFSNEPHVPNELLQMMNVVLAPHIGSATDEARRAMADLVVGNILSQFRSEL